MTRPCTRENDRDQQSCPGREPSAERVALTDLGSLVVLDNAAKSTLGGAKSSVEHVSVHLLGVALLLDTAADLERARLCSVRREDERISERPRVQRQQRKLTVVRAVGNGDELLVLSLVREPCLEIVLLGSGVVEGARDDGDELVWEAEGLVEALGVGDHVVEHLPGGRRVGDAELGKGEHEISFCLLCSWKLRQRGLERTLRDTSTHLLNLLELVNTENSEHIAARGSSLFPEASRVTGVLDGKLLGRLVEPLVHVHGGDGLLRGGDEVFLVILAVSLDLSAEESQRRVS